jgi:hypothetical protein
LWFKLIPKNNQISNLPCFSFGSLGWKYFALYILVKEKSDLEKEDVNGEKIRICDLDSSCSSHTHMDMLGVCLKEELELIFSFIL